MAYQPPVVPPEHQQIAVPAPAYVQPAYAAPPAPGADAPPPAASYPGATVGAPGLGEKAVYPPQGVPVVNGQPQQYFATPQGYVAGQQVVLVQAQPIFGTQPQLILSMQDIVCPNCHTPGRSVVTYDNGLLTFLVAGGLCIVGCWLCCCIPFCIDDLKDAIHTCPNCKATVGMSKRIS
ncbi:LPS-induced TNF-alpha factor [Zopfochytrium polystomum]|nr:LPS-induced TNF-alpha factor [Zopfochytrium polystomum]